MNKFKFGYGVFSWLGTRQIRTLTLNYAFVHIKVNVVPANVLLHLGLDFLHKEIFVANTVQKGP